MTANACARLASARRCAEQAGIGVDALAVDPRDRFPLGVDRVWLGHQRDPRAPGLEPEQRNARGREQQRGAGGGGKRLPLPRRDQRNRHHQTKLRLVGDDAQQGATKDRPPSHGSESGEQQRAGDESVLTEANGERGRGAQHQRHRVDRALNAGGGKPPGGGDRRGETERKEQNSRRREWQPTERQQQQ